MPASGVWVWSLLADPDVPIDNNLLERVLSVIPMGRRYAQYSIMNSKAQR